MEPCSNFNIVRLILKGEDTMSDKEIKDNTSIGRGKFSSAQCNLQLVHIEEHKLLYVNFTWHRNDIIENIHLICELYLWTEQSQFTTFSFIRDINVINSANGDCISPNQLS